VADADIALRMDRVYKRFRRGEIHDSLRDLVPALVRRRLGPRSEALRPEEFWALEDVSFEVRKGEAFGIIGQNGAGKSTMLKHLSGIMQPTRGRIDVHGRLSALIEIGAGFHPDLTGRENVFLNGTILGMGRREIRAKFDEIVAFAGLEEFIDTPVKRYSSGMFARLGFSVAAHLDPDILVIDEVLSVGDYLFQRKGIEKMTSVVKGGATVIFVSHNLAAVADLCERTLLLDHGRVASLGPTREVIRDYLTAGRAEGRETGDRPAWVSGLALHDAEGPTVRFESGSEAWLEVEVRAREVTRRVAVVLDLRDENFYEIFNTSSERLGAPPVDLAPGETRRFRFRLRLHLATGTYHMAVLLYRYDVQHEYDRLFPGITFFVRSESDVRGAVNLYPGLEQDG